MFRSIVKCYILLSLGFLLLTDNIVHAQSTDKKIDWGLTLAPSINFFTVPKPIQQIIQYTPRLGYEGSVNALFALGKHWGLQVAMGTSLVRYLRLEYDYTGQILGYERLLTGYIHDQVFHVSFLGRFWFSGREDGLYATLGPEVSIARDPGTIWAHSQNGHEFFREKSQPHWFKPNTALQASLGYAFRLKCPFMLGVEPYFRFYEVRWFSLVPHHCTAGLRIGMWL